AAQEKSNDGSPQPVFTEHPETSSKRNIVVLLPGVLDLLVAQHVERAADAAPRAVRQDHLVDVAALGGDERVGKPVLILLDAPRDLVRIAKLRPIQDLDGTLGPHDRDLG